MYSRDTIASVIAQRTIKNDNKHDLAYAIAGYLLQEKHIHDVDSIMREVMVYRAKMGFIEANVISAYPLDSKTKKAVLSVVKQRYPNAKSYLLNESVDSHIVGGVRIECCGEELDLTLRGKLNKFKRLTAMDEG